MQNACDSDSRCGLACDASARDAKSLAMWVERCEPLSYAVVFLLRPPYLLRRGPFFERRNVCNSQENGLGTRCAAVSHPAVLKILRVANLLRVVFLVRRGPLGIRDAT